MPHSPNFAQKATNLGTTSISCWINTFVYIWYHFNCICPSFNRHTLTENAIFVAKLWFFADDNSAYFLWLGATKFQAQCSLKSWNYIKHIDILIVKNTWKSMKVNEMHLKNIFTRYKLNFVAVFLKFWPSSILMMDRKFACRQIVNKPVCAT